MSKLVALSALVGLAFDALTKEKLQAANEELSANDFNLEVVATGTVANLEERISALEASVAAKEKEVATLTASVATKDTEISALKKELKSAAGEETTQKTTEDHGLNNSKPFHEMLSEEILANSGL